jgi:hypothetical protein
VGARTWFRLENESFPDMNQSFETPRGGATSSRPTPTGGSARPSHAAIANQAKTIRIPTHIGERQHKLARAARTLAPALSREPSLEELAEATGLLLGHGRQALGCAEASVSLKQAVGPDGDTELADFLADPLPVTPLRGAGCKRAAGCSGRIGGAVAREQLRQGHLGRVV